MWLLHDRGCSDVSEIRSGGPEGRRNVARGVAVQMRNENRARGREDGGRGWEGILYRRRMRCVRVGGKQSGRRREGGTKVGLGNRD